jgi:hypothetical protein
MQKIRKAVATFAILNACADSGFSKREPMHEPTGRTPQVDCSISAVRGILNEGDPQSRLVFAGVPITVQRSSYDTPYWSSATTSFSLNNGLGWHGVAEGRSVTYIATDERPTDMRISLRYRIDERRVMMQAEPDCDLRCNQNASLAIEINLDNPARITSRRQNRYTFSLGNFSNNERYCGGICVLSERSVNDGPVQEFQIVKNNGEDRVDIHFPLARLGVAAYINEAERCATFGLERVCIMLQGFDINRREAHTILRIETNCTIVTPQ